MRLNERVSRQRIYRVAKKLGTFRTPYNFIKYRPIFKLFHYQNREKICNNSIITKEPTATSSASLHYLVKCQCLKSNNW